MSNVRKCEICGNVATVVYDSGVPMHCCGQPMTVEKAKSVEVGTEKHRPVIENVAGGVNIKVGSIEHPMTKEHYIMFIQVLQDGKVVAGRQLSPGDKPEAFFAVTGKNIEARAYCNIHGLWKN